MISINPISTTNYSFRAKSFKSNPVSKPEQKTNKQQYIQTAVVGLAVVGAATVIAGKASVSTYEKALKKNGVEIKDGVAFLKNTGEKFTGKIKHNVKAFGFKKETVEFSNGLISEKIYHNICGKELEGEFYRDGIKRVTVTKDSKNGRYGLCAFDKDGRLTIRGEGVNHLKNKFDAAREYLKSLK